MSPPSTPLPWRWDGKTPRRLVRGPVILGYLVVLLFFGGLGTFAATAYLSSATVASGVVSPDGSRKTVQHLEGGIIAQILVDDGDMVQAGDRLAVLESTQAHSAFAVLQAKRRLLAAQLARLLAEQGDEDEINFPTWLGDSAGWGDESEDVMKTQRDLFAARREVHAGRRAIGAKRIEELEEEIKGLRQLIKSQETQVKLLDEELAAKKKLLDRDLLPRPDYLAMLRLQEQIKGELAGNSAKVARARQTIGETQLQIVSEDARRLDEIVSQLVETRSELAAVDEHLNAKRDILQRTVVLAPVGGVIVQKRFHTTGGVVGPGQPILDIVPQDAELVIDARVRPVDIDEVVIGQQAQVHFLALVDRNLPQISGVLHSISADSLIDEVTRQPYFLARIKVPDEEMDKLGKNVRITPGMPVEVLITTGERTMLEYLTQPILGSLRRTFKES
jgi:HlyD family secretion protein